jgi:hypothetical protein
MISRLTHEEAAHYTRCLAVLHRMATENTGWRGFFRRWHYSDEPLRNDAANLVREAGYETMLPEHTQLVCSCEHQTPTPVPSRARHR